jgi:hypothetical protein
MSSMLHITDGESVAGTLRESGVPGYVAIYGDLMYEGPTPAGLSREAWRETRASFHADAGYASLEDARQYLKSCDEALEASSRHEETVLWLDHRLSNQLILIKALDWFSRHTPGNAKFSLICHQPIDLGQLTADRLAPLLETRLHVTREQFSMAQAAWNAFTSADPMAIQHLLEAGVSALPFLAAALRRHLEQFPSVDNGLSRSERQALTVLRETGPLSAPRLFVAVQSTEQPVFMGDHSFYRLLAGLDAVRCPLVQTANSGDHAITEAAFRVMEGRDDHIRLNGIDRWLGGVHLKGDAAAWRWDRVSGRLVHRPPAAVASSEKDPQAPPA